MANTIKKTGFGDAELAAKVIETFARDGVYGVRYGFCGEGGRADHQQEECAPGKLVAAALKDNASEFICSGDGVITREERQRLLGTGFSKGFVNALAGTDGKRAIHERVRQLVRNIEESEKESMIPYSGESDKTNGFINQLTCIGPDAESAIPALIEMDDSANVMHFSEFITSFGKRSLPYLMNAILSGNDQKCGTAAYHLGKLGPVAKKALPRLYEISKDTAKPEMTRTRAMFAISQIDGSSGEMVELYKEMMSDSDVIFSYAAKFLLIKAADSCYPALAAVIEMLESPDVDTRLSVVRELGLSKSRYLIPTLYRMRDNDPDPGLRDMAKAALKMIESRIP